MAFVTIVVGEVLDYAHYAYPSLGRKRTDHHSERATPVRQPQASNTEILEPICYLPALRLSSGEARRNFRLTSGFAKCA